MKRDFLVEFEKHGRAPEKSCTPKPLCCKQICKVDEVFREGNSCECYIPPRVAALPVFGAKFEIYGSEKDGTTNVLHLSLLRSSQIK